MISEKVKEEAIMCFLFFLLLAVAVSAHVEEDWAEVASDNSDLFEGDILGYDPDDRNAIPNENYRWPDKKVPYIIDESLGKYKKLILSAMDEYQDNTCLQFVERTTEKNYLKIFSGNGCYSNIGMMNSGKQDLSLDRHCRHKGSVLHELGHAIGLYHEHSRPDRDQHLIVYWDNIKRDNKRYFKLMHPAQSLLVTPFDYDSIMLYGSSTYAKKKGLITMTTKKDELLTPYYKKSELSKTDIEKIRKLYKCPVKEEDEVDESI